MQRFASVIGLPMENVQAYERLHAEVWPGVTDGMRASNIINYSLFRHAGILMSYFEYAGDDYDADMRALAADPVSQEWSAVCRPLQAPLPSRAAGQHWAPMNELFHLD